MMYIVSPLAGLGGGILWRPPAYCLFASAAVSCSVLKQLGFHGIMKSNYYYENRTHGTQIKTKKNRKK